MSAITSKFDYDFIFAVFFWFLSLRLIIL